MKRVVAAVIRRSDGRVLVARRAPGQRLEGAWEFPGGKVHEGESDRAALKRELFEEFGVESVIGGFLTSSRFCDEHGAIDLFAYDVRWKDVDPRLTVHDRIEWLPPERLLGCGLAPADVSIAEWIANGESTKEE